ncbi:hypothetical protein [Rugosimonospora africana]|uniref:DinB superfamily protein n=1 Tax=Rugosimonospora africana TaxID=556532 RepID=A0A8J3VNY1_9ACTN|nr:hypothetical protein [Rugosimonospora africana]GIH13510.1 hypothetical protein Raf01_16820 [Rugosimonospora africana]
MDAYADFIEEAGRGSFRAPADGGWTAEQIVAHVASTNEQLIATTEAVLAGHDASFDNREATGDRQLRAYVASYGGLRGLADRVAITVAVLRDLTGQLGPLEDTPVPTRIQEGDRVMLDGPTPWGRVLQINEVQHTGGHLEQLRALREDEP